MTTPSLRRHLLSLTTLLLTAATPAGGQTPQHHAAAPHPDCYFIVWKHSGERVAFSFGEHPTIKQHGGQLVVETTNAELLFPLHTIQRFTLADRLGEGQTINTPYYDTNNDGRLTVVDVTQLIARLGSTASSSQIDAAADAILRRKR